MLRNDSRCMQDPGLSSDDEENESNHHVGLSSLTLRDGTCPPKLVKLNAVIDPSLQRWADAPPENGMGVIYVGVNLVNGKMYVGKHKGTVSVRIQRWNNHLRNCNSGSKLVLRASKKYGESSIAWFVIEYVDAARLNTLEKYWISADGLDTLAPNGYNLTSGGDGGYELSKKTIEKLKDTRNKPEYIESLRKRRSMLRPQEAMRKRQRRLMECKDDTEREILLRKFAKVDKQKDYMKKWNSSRRSSSFVYAADLKLEKRQKDLDSCHTGEERDKLTLKFLKMDSNKEYAQKVRDGVVVPNSAAMAERTRTRLLDEWKTKTPEEIAARSAKRRQTIETRRKQQLDNCSTPKERAKLVKKFASQDKGREYQAKVKSGEIVPVPRRRVQ